MKVSLGTEPPCRFCDSSPYARPMGAFAWLYGPIAPMPQFIPISLRIGPFTTVMTEAELDVLPRAEMPVAASASRMGKYAGLQPAITALTATFSTVYSHSP